MISTLRVEAAREQGGQPGLPGLREESGMLERRHQYATPHPDADAAAGRTQVAALCWRRGREGLEVLLVTSRETGRWVVPKGWPIAGLSAAEAAAKEAWEEAGVTGEVDETCVGLFSYTKVLGRERGVPCVVAVYPLRVTGTSDRFPERSERKRRWFAPKKAAKKVAEPELSALLAGFDPAPSAS